MRPNKAKGKRYLRQTHKESVQAALTLLLGPETEYSMRVRAVRRLAKQGPAILPVLLSTLSSFPAITVPAWPWWPPQYEHCARLLLYLSQQAQKPLEALLRHPAIRQPSGPVLWTSVMEAAGLLPYEDNEELLCKGLNRPWMEVRYAAVMALAARASKVPLRASTIEQLLLCLDEDEAFPVRITAAYVLLNSGESVGMEVLLQAIEPGVPAEARKAAMFILATELPAQLMISQRERLALCLMDALRDPDTDLAQYAAHALSKIALPSMLPALIRLLQDDDPQTQITILTVLEELASHKTMRQTIRRQTLLTRILPLLKTPLPEVRRQACYTFAACGGEYATAVLGTIVLDREHPGYLEAIEGLRVLQGVLRMPLRGNVVRWLLRIAAQAPEEAQVTALDSLGYMLWQAQTHKLKQAWHDISQEIIHNGIIIQLLYDSSPWVRQRTLELLTVLDNQLAVVYELPALVGRLLCTDSDSGVRACAAYICGQIEVRWAIPYLIEALLDTDEYVAQTALIALSRLATPDDAIVVYAVRELTHYEIANNSVSQVLIRDARALLKKWQKSAHEPPQFF